MTSYTTDVADDTTSDRDLISADKVQGTPVYNHADERLGTVNSIYIDKRGGDVVYVAMSFGGFLGIGEKYHPLPWELLDYDTAIGGYRVDLDREDLIDAPSYDLPALAAYDFDTDAGGINDYYSQRFQTAETIAQPNGSTPPPLGFFSPKAQSRRNPGLDGTVPTPAKKDAEKVVATTDGQAAIGPQGAMSVSDYENSNAGAALAHRDESERGR